MQQQNPTRRDFLAGTAAVGIAGVATHCAKKSAEASDSAAASAEPVPARRALGPEDTIHCGFIGVGNRGSALLRATLDLTGVAVVAVTDTYDVWRSRAVNWCRERQPDVHDYVHFEEMLEGEALDAVVIATPDHVHVPAAMAALDRGLDVYCEKPIALTAQDAKVLRNRARATGAVFQTGTQLRSMPLYQRARDAVQAGGIGQVVLVQVQRHFDGGPLGEDTVPNEANADNIHWKAFLAGAQRRPFNPLRYFNWRLFRDYSNGYYGDLMLHHLDICHYITGCAMPRRVLAAGGIYHANDGRTTPDTVSALVDYGNAGFHFNYTTTNSGGDYGTFERYIGTEGSIEVRDMERLTLQRGEAAEELRREPGRDTAHLKDFFAAMRTREKVIAPPEAGHMAAAVAHMAILSYEEGCAVAWDQDAESPVRT